MDYIYGIQNAIRYIEKHITEDLDLDEIAKQAYSSSFNFQRVFGIVCGISLGEYIRNRRLSLAGVDLASGNYKVIDIALKYGYDSPESFTRAFTKFHGISPSAVKNGGKNKLFFPISVKLTISGGKTMNFRIEQLNEFQILVKKKRFPKNKELNGKEIPLFWADCTKDGTIPKLISYVNENNIFKDSIIGIGLEYNDNETDFPYGIGVHYNGKPINEKDLEIVTIKPNTFIVFPIVGRMPDVFVGVFNYLFTEFFPNSEYKPSGIEIEAYPSDDIKNSEYHWELWFSVEKK